MPQPHDCLGVGPVAAHECPATDEALAVDLELERVLPASQGAERGSSPAELPPHLDPRLGPARRAHSNPEVLSVDERLLVDARTGVETYEGEVRHVLAGRRHPALAQAPARNGGELGGHRGALP